MEDNDDYLNSNNIFDAIKQLLKDCNKDGSDDVIRRLANSIGNLADIEKNKNLNRNEKSSLHSDEKNSLNEKIDRIFKNQRYNSFFHIFLAFSIGLFLGLLFGNHDKFPSAKKLTFEENVLQKFGPIAAPPIRYLHHHLTAENPNAPVKIFVAAENFKDIINFNQKITEVFKEFNVVPAFIDVTSEMSAGNLFNKFKDLASEAEKPLIIINNVNNLKDLAPLTIQRIIDPDTAPFKNATIILTASGMSFPEKMATKKECEIFVRKYLLDVWSSDDLSEEQTEPIISRCAGIVICVPSTKGGEL